MFQESRVWIKLLFRIVTAGLLSCSSFVEAASFNCLSNKLKPFEKNICFTESLSKLDEQVNSYYEDVLKASSDIEADKREREALLLSVRKRCKTSDCVKSTYEYYLRELKEKAQNYGKFDPNKPAYPVWISPLLTEPRVYQTGVGQILRTCKDVEFGGSFASRDNVRQIEYPNGGVVSIHEQRFQPITLTCQALEIMKNAQPANQSAVKDFAFTEKSIDVLPSFLLLNGGYGAICQDYTFNLSRIPLSQRYKYTEDFDGKIIVKKFPKEIKITSTVIDKNHLRVNTERINNPIEKKKEIIDLDIKILGRGDLTGTGWESVLVQVIRALPSENFYWSNLFILTRKKETDVFQAAHAEQYLVMNGYGEWMCLPTPNAAPGE